MKLILLSLFGIFLMTQSSFAVNKEGRLDGGRQRNTVKAYEAEGQLQRDALGRKVFISPNSQFDPESLQLDIAPGSTVILNVRQRNKGTQTVRTPFYTNVELPN